jgi:ribosomal peptide maturation radical SAM protein 1
MPFATAQIPSIQIGLLTSLAADVGWPADGFYFNIDLAAELGSDRYEWLCQHRGEMTGEWLFSVAAFGDSGVSASEDYLDAFPGECRWVDDDNRAMQPGAARAELRRLREQVLPAYVDRCAARVDWSRYQVVGFTSTFQQTTASLALATRIKQASRDTIVVFGGANMEDPMGAEHLRAFPVVDYVVSGEADNVFPEMLHALAERRPLMMPGVLGRHAGESFRGEAAPVKNLDATPIPRYDDFFEQSRKAGLTPLFRLPIEGSRGCWWGQKHHCTFCGLNGQTMGYRHKSARRLLDEVHALSSAHGIRAFDAVDNILPTNYLHDVFDVLADQRLDYEFFFEVKSSIGRRDQLKRLSRGGVRSIQPGIESLSTHVLELMKKGSTMLDNVRLLKWARYYGIQVSWNLLCGFPGETIEDYKKQCEVLALISHLEPPSGLKRIWLERFSPYFVERQHYPVHSVRALASYRYVFPDHVKLDDLAYFFDYEMDNTLPPDALTETQTLIEDWRNRWQDASTDDTLIFTRTSAALTVIDRRRRDKPLYYEIHGPMARIYESCIDTHRSADQIVAALGIEFGRAAFTEAEVVAALTQYVNAGLMITDRGRYFALALPANPYW